MKTGYRFSQYCAVKQSPCGKASMTGDEGKQVKGSAQYCAVNLSPCGKVSVTGQGGKQVTGLVVLWCGKNS